MAVPSAAINIPRVNCSTALGNYTATIACTNATSGSTTVLPTTVGGSITLRPGDS
ncbi:hypothetical protein, partial [Microcoleus sp. CAWBG50]|uniref:hypothetical protein n=1 Tax=Microcoleus sp. CAWBG50 TaxID=2841646 RepID=UPI00345D5DFD